MKIIFLCTFLIAFQSHAFDLKRLENHSWDEIKAMKNVYIEWARVNIDGQLVPVSNVCTTGEMLKSIKPIAVCTETSVVSRQACTMNESETCRPLDSHEFAQTQEMVREEVACSKFVYKNVQAKRAYLAEECTDLVYPNDEAGGAPYCAGQYVNINKMLPEAFDIPLIDNSSSAIRGLRMVMGYKTYNLPNCVR